MDKRGNLKGRSLHENTLGSENIRRLSTCGLNLNFSFIGALLLLINDITQENRTQYRRVRGFKYTLYVCSCIRTRHVTFSLSWESSLGRRPCFAKYGPSWYRVLWREKWIRAHWIEGRNRAALGKTASLRGCFDSPCRLVTWEPVRFQSRLTKVLTYIVGDLSMTTGLAFYLLEGGNCLACVWID